MVSHLWCKARLTEKALGRSPLDDFGFRNQDVHQVAAAHEIEEEVQVVLVLKAGILPDAERMCRVPSDRLFAQHMLWALHHR